MIRALFLTSRPLSWVNTAFPFAAAYLLTAREIDATLVVGTLFFLVPYNFAMYGINDVFDYQSDLRNPRKGGVEGALLDPRFKSFVGRCVGECPMWNKRHGSIYCNTPQKKYFCDWTHHRFPRSILRSAAP